MNTTPEAGNNERPFQIKLCHTSYLFVDSFLYLPHNSPCQGVVGACDHALGVRRGWRGKVATESQSVNSASSAFN